LVIDDEPAILALVRDILADEGYTVLVATDGEEGLLHAQRTAPDLILTDLMLPGLDGYTLCRILRAEARTAQTPVIAMSAAYRPQAGVAFDAVLAKPFELDTLLSVIRAYLGSP
jgi:DNA-binding response OmpR family regulator